MQKFINLFLTLVLPVSILFTMVASIYFTMSFEMNKAIKLGILTGVLGGIGFSILMASILLFMRRIRHTTHQRQKVSPKNDVEAEEEVVVETETNSNDLPSSEKTSYPADKLMDQKFLLLMDKELAFEVALHAVMDQNIGEISNADKNKRSVIIRATNETIALSITSLTKHTSEVLITALPNSKNVQDIISYLKEKEYSFLDY